MKVHSSKIAILGIFLGLLPYIILAFLLQTKHQLTAPFCEPCWAKLRSAKIYNAVNMLLFLMILIGGLAFSLYSDSVYSEWYLLASILLSLVLLAAGSRFIRTLEPRYKKVSSKEVIIDAPHVGEIVFSK